MLHIHSTKAQKIRHQVCLSWTNSSSHNHRYDKRWSHTPCSSSSEALPHQWYERLLWCCRIEYNNVFNVWFVSRDWHQVIPRVRQIFCQEVFTAVAVKAIIRTVSGIRLLTSLRFTNSFQKFSPLWRVKYNRCSSNSTFICIAVKCTVIRSFKSLTISWHSEPHLQLVPPNYLGK